MRASVCHGCHRANVSARVCSQALTWAALLNDIYDGACKGMVAEAPRRREASLHSKNEETSAREERKVRQPMWACRQPCWGLAAAR
jgi:hypothetical protein